ncbi:MAG: hypothetical protein WAU88_00075 [Candidatus Zixiibacteriota bacterium]
MDEVEKTTLVYSARWYDVRALILAGSLALVVGLGIAALTTFVGDRLERRDYAGNNKHLYVSGRFIEGSGAVPMALKEGNESPAPTMFGFGIRIKLVPYETRDVEELVKRLSNGNLRCGYVGLPQRFP